MRHFTTMSLAKFEITPSMFSDHYRIRLEININDIFKMFKQFEIKQYDSRQSITGEIRKYFKLNENTIYQTFGVGVKAVARGKWITLSTCFKRK